MEPVRMMLVEDATLPGGGEPFVSRWSYLWVIEESGPGGRAVVEYRNKRYTLSRDLLVPVPVAAPSPERLATLDPCIAGIAKGGAENFLEEVHRDDARMFSLFRCKAHGAFFLDDLRGGIGMYDVFIFIGNVKPSCETEYVDIWKEYHYIPVDALAYLGILLPNPA